MEDQDADLLRALQDEHGDALFAHSVRLTGGDRRRAEDLVQETLLRAWRHADELDGSHGSVRAWLFTVARHIVIDEWRTPRSRHELTVADLPDQPEQHEDVDALLLSWMVTDSLSRLSPDHRAVIRECFYRGASVAEAARRLGIPEGTVKSRTHYALRALRLVLDEMGVGP